MTVYGKKRALARLSEFCAAKRFPHALLFTGENGTGKLLLADYTAMLLLCEKGGGNPCFSCKGCRRAENHNHPDVVYVKPILEAAKAKPGCTMVAALRDVVKNGYLKPNDGDIRVYIFEDAETMTPECQNTLLKFIEEPLEFNRFIFTSSSENSILPTIRSRVIKITADASTAVECAEALVERGIEKDEAAVLSERFSGNIGRCVAAHENSDEMKLLDGVSAVLGAVAKKNEFETAAAFTAFSTRELLKQALTEALAIMRDALAFQDKYPPSGTDKVLSQKLASVFAKKKLFNITEIFEKYVGLIELNLNVNITANAVTAEIFDIIQRKEL